MMMTEPIVSKKFDIEDICRIREYNSMRHIKMTADEIIADTKKGGKNYGTASERIALAQTW